MTRQADISGFLIPRMQRKKCTQYTRWIGAPFSRDGRMQSFHLKCRKM